MPRPIGPRKIYRYSAEFKATAVALSRLDGVAESTAELGVLAGCCSRVADRSRFDRGRLESDPSRQDVQ